MTAGERLSPVLLAEVAGALAEPGGGAVVALETSIVAQGLPRPANLDVGRAMVAAVRSAGAVPALTAVLDGRARLGLADTDLVRLVAAADVVKVSARDLARVAVCGGTGATTVAGTARLAALAGIRVMATGGIGGVHRGFASRPDVSADLGELARSTVAVVCAGAKSILDLPATAEVLEALGVPIWGWRTDRLPAFYEADGGSDVPRFDDLATLAQALSAHWALGGGGVVVVQAPPSPLDRAAVAGWMAAAEAEARAAGVRGAALSPFLLQALARLSGGRTVAANRDLVLANAGLAGRLAVALRAQVAGNAMQD